MSSVTQQPIASSQSFIPLSEPVLEPNVWLAVKDALDSGWVSSVGPYVTQFEETMAHYVGVKKALATVNGTAALHVALMLLNIGPGDEVIVPSMTFIATINAIRYVGATPVFWDSCADHWNADISQLALLITPKTKAIMAVHLYGDPVDMPQILAIATQHGLPVIEDAAEALGASWQGQSCGSWGTLGCLSFNGNKTLTTGGGGMLLTNDLSLYDRGHYLINQAKDDPLCFVHHEVGYNFRLTNVQAAMGVAQLESLPGFLERKRELVSRYDTAFSNVAGLSVFKRPAGEAQSSYWLYTIALNSAELPDGKTSLDLVHALKDHHIQARPFFMPGHRQQPFQPFVNRDYPNADKWQRLGINLPSTPNLMDADQQRVIGAVVETITQWRQA